MTIAIEATEHVWVRVLQDGQKVFDGFMSLGQMESWSGDESVAVETGNGAGFPVTFNERLQGPMCGRGEVCERILDIDDSIKRGYIYVCPKCNAEDEQ